jgi:hypothetical protein
VATSTGMAASMAAAASPPFLKSRLARPRELFCEQRNAHVGCIVESEPVGRIRRWLEKAVRRANSVEEGEPKEIRLGSVPIKTRVAILAIRWNDEYEGRTICISEGQ